MCGRMTFHTNNNNTLAPRCFGAAVGPGPWTDVGKRPGKPWLGPTMTVTPLRIQ